MKYLNKFIDVTGRIDAEHLNKEVYLYSLHCSEALKKEVYRKDGLSVLAVAEIALGMIADTIDDKALHKWLNEYGDGIHTLTPVMQQLEELRH